MGHRPVEGKQVEVHEFDWAGKNQIVYQENGVTVRSFPAWHAIDGSVCYSLEWNGMKFVYGSDNSANDFILEYAKGADVFVHECFITVEMLQKKFGFSLENAVNVGTKIHTSPQACGRIFALTQPRHAIAYHFFNDIETNQAVYNELRKTYDGPLSLAKDLRVWNITPDEVVEREVVYNVDTWPMEAEGAKPPSELTWEPHHPMSDWLAQARVTWDDVDQFE
jgi:ribonuclease Z